MVMLAQRDLRPELMDGSETPRSEHIRALRRGGYWLLMTTMIRPLQWRCTGGSETQIASDGQEAVEKAAKFRPDLILLDIGLPKKRLRSLPGNSPAAVVQRHCDDCAHRVGAGERSSKVQRSRLRQTPRQTHRARLIGNLAGGA